MTAYTPGETIRREHLSSMSMANGNERCIRRVRIDGEVKEWVGFGWINVTEQTSARQAAKIPLVTE